MLVSELPLDGSAEFMVQKKDDSYRIIKTESTLNAYIEQFGDVEIVHRHGRFYDVPAHAPYAERFMAAKAAWCNQYGCE